MIIPSRPGIGGIGNIGDIGDIGNIGGIGGGIGDIGNIGGIGGGIGITIPGTGPQITPSLRPLSIANTGASVTPDTSLVKDENLGGDFGDIKTITFYRYFNITQVDPDKDEIT